MNKSTYKKRTRDASSEFCFLQEKRIKMNRTIEAHEDDKEFLNFISENNERQVQLLSSIPLEIWITHIIPLLTFKQRKSLKIVSRLFLYIVSQYWYSPNTDKKLCLLLRDEQYGQVFIDFILSRPDWPTKFYCITPTYSLRPAYLKKLLELPNIGIIKSIPSSEHFFASQYDRFPFMQYSEFKNVNKICFYNQYQYPLSDSFIYTLPSSLTFLRISHNQDITGVTFPSLPTNLKILILSGCRNLTDYGIQTLSQPLIELDITFCVNLTSKSIENLASTLKTLRLPAHMGLEKEDINKLPKGITHLDLSGVKLSDDSIECLPQSLTHLNISSSHNLTDACIEFLPRTLTHLNIFQAKFSGATFKFLPPKLCTFIFESCEQVLLDFLPDLPKTIKSLYMSNSNYTLDDIMENLHLPELSLLYFNSITHLITKKKIKET
jgi:hypothetical protein